MNYEKYVEKLLQEKDVLDLQVKHEIMLDGRVLFSITDEKALKEMIAFYLVENSEEPYDYDYLCTNCLTGLIHMITTKFGATYRKILM
ncbi:hypothetical protein LCFBJUUZ_CDS0116 [Staphylococcus phage PG-2021_76]